MKFLVFIGLFFSYIAIAQQRTTASPAMQPQALPVFKQITHPFMPAITSEYFYFTEDGLMWFSTAQGLTSFDGSEVIYYSTLQEANTLGLTRIAAITEDKEHNLYIAGLFGLVYFNRIAQSFTALSYTFSDTKKQSNIYFDALSIDNAGLVYAGSVNNGLFIFDPGKKQFYHYNLDAAKQDSWQDRWYNTISCFADHATDSTKMWVGTFRGIYLFNKKTKTFTRRFEIINPGLYQYKTTPTGEQFDLQKMDVTDDSTIWFNSWTSGFGKYNTRTGIVKLFLHDALLKTSKQYVGYIMPKFAKLSPQKYLLGIYNGRSAIFDTRTETATFFNVTKEPYPEEQTRFVSNDRLGNTWLLQRGFVYATIPENLRLQFVDIPAKANSISKPQVRGIYFDTATGLYYATFLHSDAGVHVFDSSFRQTTVITTPLINNYYTFNATLDAKITKDGSGRLWTAGWENYLLLPGKKSFEPVEKNFPNLAWLKAKGECIDVVTTRDGNILMKNKNGIVYHIHHRTLVTDTLRAPEMERDGVEIKYPTTWYDKKRDVVYLTSNADISQLHLRSGKSTIIPYTSLFGNLPANQGLCVSTLDAGGRIWFLVPKYGIRIIDPETLACTDSIPFGTRGLMRGDYTTFTGALSPYILLRSHNGIVVYDFAKQQSFLFDRSNGLSSPETKSLLYCNGYMIIGQTERFEYFKLADLDRHILSIKPHLNTIVADSVAVFTRSGRNEPTTVSLLHQQNTVSLSFSAPEFFFPERIEYAYQLSGVNKDWQYTNSLNRRITYTNLAPGKYIFQLKAQMKGGNWNAAPVEYSVIITPAWWQTIGFKLLCVLTIAALIFYFTRKRVQAVRKKEQLRSAHEKELFELEAKALRAQMNPHFIFNCLNSIKALIQKNQNDAAANYLTTFSKLIRTLFQNSDKREVSLHEEIETCKLYTQLEAMRFAEKVSFRFAIDERIDLKDIKVPALILQPFIENAIWHGLVPKETGGFVNVSVQQQNGSVLCIVDDDGIGRELSKQYDSRYETTHESKGISLTHTRLQLDKLLNEREDDIEIIDKKDGDGKAEGTTVILSFKNSNA